MGKKRAGETRELYMGVAKTLRAERRAREISQEELGRRLGVATSTISQFESGGKNMQLPSVARYAREMGFDLVLELRPRGTDTNDVEQGERQ